MEQAGKRSGKQLLGDRRLGRMARLWVGGRSGSLLERAELCHAHHGVLRQQRASDEGLLYVTSAFLYVYVLTICKMYKV